MNFRFYKSSLGSSQAAEPDLMGSLIIVFDAYWLALGEDALSVSQACLSGASWPVFRLASVPLDLARLGVNGFVYFSRKKSRSAAGPRPGNHQ